MMSVETYKKEIETDILDEVKDLAIIAWNGVVDRTPVRTGQTRQSWNISVGGIDISTVDVDGTPGSPLARPTTPSFEYDKFEVINVSNAKPHILYLEYGSPTTVPYGMLQATLSSL